jgi:tetratricopeptide (TPR) repeat protein
MRVQSVALLLSMPFGAFAQSDQDWTSCKALDADQLALAACTRLIEAGDLSAHDLAVAYYNRGAAHWRRYNLDDSVADENIAIALDPNLADAYMRRGAAYFNKGDYDRSIADSSKAIELDPNNVRAYTNRCNVRGNKGDLDGALADATKAIEIDPDFVAGYVARGIAYQRRHEHGLANADFSKATEIEPKSGFDGYRIRADAFLARATCSTPSPTTTAGSRSIRPATRPTGHAACSTSGVRTTSTRLPISARCWNSIPSASISTAAARLSTSAKSDFDHAITDLTNAFDLDPKNALTYYYTRGRAFASKGDHDRAIDDFTKRIELQPDNADAYRDRAQAYMDNHDNLAAQRDYWLATETARKRMESSGRLQQ